MDLTLFIYSIIFILFKQFFPLVPQEHFSFKMYSHWKMKILMMWQLWLTKRCAKRSEASGLFINGIWYILLLFMFQPAYLFKLSQDNVFVMSNKKSKYPVLQVDLRLTSVMIYVLVITTQRILYLLGWLTEGYLIVLRNCLSLGKCYVSVLISFVNESVLLDYGIFYFNDVSMLEIK